MENIDWNIFNNQRTIAQRRRYLREDLFKEREKRSNKTWFVVNPLRAVDADLPLMNKLSRGAQNFGKNLLRHIILPFPVTWTHRHSDRLTKKRVFSMEDYVMGDFRHKDHISSLRTGAPQYRGILIGAATVLVGLIAAGTFAAFTLGIPALLAIGAVGLYVGYAAYRASRKSKIQVAILKTRMGNPIENHDVEQTFARLYKFVSVLERLKRNIAQGELGGQDVKNMVLNTINHETNPAYHGDKGLTIQMNKLIGNLVNEFIGHVNENDSNNDTVSTALEDLVNSIEGIDVAAGFEAMRTEEMLNDLEKSLNQDPDENQAQLENLNLVRGLFNHLKSSQNGPPYSIQLLVHRIKSLDIEENHQNTFITALGGEPLINMMAGLGKAKNERKKSSRKHRRKRRTPTNRIGLGESPGNRDDDRRKPEGHKDTAIPNSGRGFHAGLEILVDNDSIEGPIREERKETKETVVQITFENKHIDEWLLDNTRNKSMIDLLSESPKSDKKKPPKRPGNDGQVGTKNLPVSTKSTRPHKSQPNIMGQLDGNDLGGLDRQTAPTRTHANGATTASTGRKGKSKSKKRIK